MKDERTTKAKDGSATVAAWDFERPSDPVMSLWPPTNAPQRLRRHLTARDQDGALAVKVEGADPAFSWDFTEPVAAAVAEIAVEADAPGMIQLFWTSLGCPVYAESCSAKATLAIGSNVVSFFLDDQNPIRTLRLDPPDRVGAHLTVNSFVLRSNGTATSRFEPVGTVEALTTDAYALVVQANGTDPGIVVQTPGLLAERATTVELSIRGPAGAEPQLFWTGPCAHFSEACSSRLVPVDAGALTHRATLRGRGEWRTAITSLRLDPGAIPGRYSVEHLALVREPSE